jgi:ribosomal-protein-alanine N-acetyltransferase
MGDVADTEIHTERLRLRRWRASDLDPFAALNTDPEVMEFLPAPLTRAESDALVERIEVTFDARGFGLWAVESLATRTFAGFVGLWPTNFDAHFAPAVEVGWRLARHAWGHGYASEAAQAATADGFERVGLTEIVSFTAVVNRRSWRVMERLGMTRDPAEDFDHPTLPPGHRLRPHVLYRLPAPDQT